MNYYQRHIGDYLKDTAHLSLLEHGIYTRLLDVYYTRESGIPDDQAARLIGARGSEIKALKTVLSEFFQLIDGIWSQDRCDREIELYKSKSEKASRSANARWEKEQTHTERNANAMRTHSEGNAPINQEPITNNHKPITNTKKHTDLFVLPEWIDPVLWDEWMAIRKKLKAVNSKRAMDGLVEKLFQVSQSGISVNTAIKTAIERSWKSVEVDWLKPKNGKRDGYAEFLQDPARGAI
jgi:uncharacterized protein YdaU (DUF1376 family)